MPPIPDISKARAVATSLVSIDRISTEMRAASPWKRAGAFCIDMILIQGAAEMLSHWLALFFLKGFWQADVKLVSIDTFQRGYLHTTSAIFPGAFLFLAFVYFLVFLHFFGSSIGKGLLGIKVVTRHGEYPEPLAVARRLLATLLAAFSFGFLFVLGAFGRRGLCVQDEVSHTFVVEARNRKRNQAQDAYAQHGGAPIQVLPELVYRESSAESKRAA